MFFALVPLYAAAAAPSGTFLIKNVRVFDGERLTFANSVLVRGGKIAEVGVDVATPGMTPVYDGHGNTLLPGLIDSHTHCYMAAALQQEIMFGVTTTLDMQSDPKFAIPIQKAQQRGGHRDMADIYTAGWAATTPGGHGTQFGMQVPTLSSASEAQAFVDARIGEGSNYIKILYDSGNEFGFPYKNMTLDMVSALTTAAKKRGKKVLVHIQEKKLALEAAGAGADGLAHLFVDTPPDPGFGAAIAAKGMFVIPTLTGEQAVTGARGSAEIAKDSRITPFLTTLSTRSLNSGLDFVKPPTPLNIEFAYQTVRQLLAHRVPILAGTDAPVPGTWFGVSMHRELEMLVEAGMTPIQALQAATSVPARMFNLSDRGRIAKGRRADLLLVSGNPTRNIRDTRGIVAIWKLGTPVDRSSLRDTWEKAIAGRAQ